jgi:hypothetical protein
MRENGSDFQAFHLDCRMVHSGRLFVLTTTFILQHFRILANVPHMMTMWRSSMAIIGYSLLCFLLFPGAFSQWIPYPDSGQATLTHYDLPRGYVAACGCTPETTHYPVAALSQMAFGSSANFGAYQVRPGSNARSDNNHRPRMWKVLQLNSGQPSCCDASLLP